MLGADIKSLSECLRAGEIFGLGVFKAMPVKRQIFPTIPDILPDLKRVIRPQDAILFGAALDSDVKSKTWPH